MSPWKTTMVQSGGHRPVRRPPVPCSRPGLMVASAEAMVGEGTGDEARIWNEHRAKWIWN